MDLEKLFEYLANEHDLLLLESDRYEIELIINEAQTNANPPLLNTSKSKQR